MDVTKTDRGFDRIDFTDHNGAECSLQQSSAIGDYPNSMNCPGSSYVWLGVDLEERGSRMHLDREQVQSLIVHLQAWLLTGKFMGEGAGK